MPTIGQLNGFGSLAVVDLVSFFRRGNAEGFFFEFLFTAMSSLLLLAEDQDTRLNARPNAASGPVGK